MGGAARYDVVIASDLRHSGGTSASIAEEIKAQARAGYRTALVHLPGPHLRRTGFVNPRVLACVRAGLADLVPSTEEISARLAVVRQPRVLDTPEPHRLRLRAESAMVVLNQGPTDAEGGERYWNPPVVRERAAELLGPDARWAPIGPLVRANVAAADPSLPLEPDDWHNVIDLDEWGREPLRPASDRHPVIGRHSRSDPKKWPSTAEGLRAVYPTSGDVLVRVLGGAEPAEVLLGGLPASWEVLPFGSMAPQRFLRTLHAYVYYHHPRWVEAFGRSVLEALATGVPTVLPHHFAATFGDAALYAEPEEVGGLVRRLHGDEVLRRACGEHAQQRVHERFDHAVHERRLRALIGPPQATVPVAGARPRRRARVLMLSSNGSGLGHLTRQMAVARRLPESVEPVFATQSQAAAIVAEAGYFVEHIPSRERMGADHERWNAYLRDRLDDLLASVDPQAVVVDGTVPYDGLLQVMEHHRDRWFVWLRRGLWRAGLGAQWLQRGSRFDAVIEPGDLAAGADRGLTAGAGDAQRVDPIVLLDPDELLDRDHARAELGLDPDRPAALVQLGAGNINDVATPAALLTRALLAREGTQVRLAQSPIALEPLSAPPGAAVVSRYPLARYLRAFDVAVTAAGYNSVHELVRFAVPSLVVPNHETSLDDQATRAAALAEDGLVLQLPQVTGATADAAVARLLDPAVQQRLRARCEARAPGDGAAQAATLIARLLSVPRAAAGPTTRGDAPRPELLETHVA